MSDTELGTSASVKERPSLLITVVLFYLVSLALVASPILPSAVLRDIMIAISAAFGGLMVYQADESNVWALFAIGFVQPIVMTLPGILANPELFFTAVSAQRSIEIGAASAVAGIVTSVATRGARSVDFSLAYVRVFAGRASELGQDTIRAGEVLDKLIKSITTFVTAAILVYKLLG